MIKSQKVLKECCGQSGVTADPSASVLKNVKVLGLESLNKRRYKAEAVKEAIRLYEGRFVNIDHPIKPNEPRAFSSRFGLLKGVREDREAGGLRADLHYNPKHPMAETVRWWAENSPGALGLSHDAVGQGKDENGTFVVEKILDVRAVDLVADPATTKGLFEGANMPDPMLGGDMGGGGGGGGGGTLDEHIANAIQAIVKDTALDKKAKLKKIGVALGLLDEGESVSTSKGGEPADMPTEEQLRRHPAYKAMLERVDRLETTERLGQKRALADRVISEAKLPAEAVSELFREQLMTAKDEAAMKALVEDRRRLAGIQRPKSAAGGQQGTLTREQFREQLRKN